LRDLAGPPQSALKAIDQMSDAHCRNVSAIDVTEI
jgi:hypothetical protein